MHDQRRAIQTIPLTDVPATAHTHHRSDTQGWEGRVAASVATGSTKV